MKKFKITCLVFYILFIIFLVIESCIPSTGSKKQSDAVGSIVGRICNIFVRDKITKAKEITIADTLDEYYVNDILDLSATVLPDKATYSSLTYETSDDKIAKINSKGIISFVGKGDVTITVKQIESEIEKEIKFKVIEILTTDLLINVSKNNMLVGTSMSISSTITPSNATTKSISYTSSDNDIAIIDNGMIYAKKEGNVTITARTSNGIEKSVDITILKNTNIVLPQNIMITGKSNLTVSNKEEFSASVTPTNVTNMYVIWESSNSSVASIDKNGNVTPRKAGDVVITAYTFNREKLDTIEVSVRNVLPIISVSDLKIVKGKSASIEISISNNPTYQNYTYTSSDESLVLVSDDGTISALKEGKATITVKCDDGFDSVSQAFEVNVRKQQIYDKITSFNLIIRKVIGHFLAFAFLGGLGIISFSLFSSKKLMYSLCFATGFAVATITEIIQLFVEGRTGRVYDVAIDYSGYLTGVLICFLVAYLFKKKQKN